MNQFGRKKKLFIQEANRRSILKGTVGSFRSWCSSQGLTKDGKVTRRCINKGINSKNSLIKKRAIFAKNIGGYVGAKHIRVSRFGEIKIARHYSKMSLDELNTEIKSAMRYYNWLKQRHDPGFNHQQQFVIALRTLIPEAIRKEEEEKRFNAMIRHRKLVETGMFNYRRSPLLNRQFGKSKVKVKKKYTSAGGRKSPGVSAKNFPIGTVKKGLDNNNWVIVKVGNSQRWKRISSFGKKRNYFGSYSTDDDEYINSLIKEENPILLKIEKEIDLAEDILDQFPEDIPEKKHSESILKKIKNKLKNIDRDDIINFFTTLLNIISYLADLSSSLMLLYTGTMQLHNASALFRTVVKPVNKLINRFAKNEIKIEDEAKEKIEKEMRSQGYFKTNIHGTTTWIHSSKIPGYYPEAYDE